MCGENGKQCSLMFQPYAKGETEMKSDYQNRKDEKLELLFHQLEDYVQSGLVLRDRFEEFLDTEKPKKVHESESKYCSKKQSDVAIMPDFYLDDNGVVIDVGYTVVKQV